MISQHVLIFFSLLFSGMPESFARSFTVADAQQQAWLGKGYNSSSENFMGDCIVGQQEWVGQNSATATFQKMTDYEEVMSSLGFKAGGKTRFGIVSASASAQFARNASSSVFSETMTFKMEGRFKNLKIKEVMLPGNRPFDPFVLNQGHELWVKRCGNEFVEQVVLGSSLFINIKIDFVSKEDKELFSATFNFKNASMSEISGALSSASSRFASKASVSINLLQLGGDISRLSTLLDNTDVGVRHEQDSNKVNAMLVCSLTRMDACLAVLNRALQYATDKDDVSSFANQIDFTVFDPSSPHGPATIGYVTAPWEILGINPPPKILTHTILFARESLAKAFEYNLQYQNRIDSLKNSKIRLSRNQVEQIAHLEDKIHVNMTRIQDAVAPCYDEIDLCVEVVEKLHKELSHFHEKDFEIRPETFAQYCDLAYLKLYNIKLRNTVDRLIAIARDEVSAFGEDLCGEASEVLNSLEEISLNEKNILDLRPIAALKNLKTLSLKRNALEDVRGLKDLENLQYLNIGHNRIRYFFMNTQMLNLQELRIHGNLLDKKDVLILKSKIPLVVVTDSEACLRHNENLFDHKLIDEDEKIFLDRKNFSVMLTDEDAFKPQSIEYIECSLVGKYL